MLPREDGGVVDNKLKVSVRYHEFVATMVQARFLGVRDDKYPCHRHFNHPASHWSPYAR